MSSGKRDVFIGVCLLSFIIIPIALVYFQNLWAVGAWIVSPILVELIRSLDSFDGDGKTSV